MINCPTIEVNARKEKNDFGGSYLLSLSTGDVRLIVTKIGNVRKRS
jgi:hypothetical protein